MNVELLPRAQIFLQELQCPGRVSHTAGGGVVNPISQWEWALGHQLQTPPAISVASGDTLGSASRSSEL